MGPSRARRQPSARLIRDSHAVAGQVARGEVTPQCRRAQRASEIASEYPLSVASLMEEQDRRIAELRPRRRRQVVYDDEPEAPKSGLQEKDKEAMLQVLFGQAAPQATQVLSWCKTPTGQAVVGVTSVAALALALSA